MTVPPQKSTSDRYTVPSTSVFQVDVSEEGFFTRILRAFLVSLILATTKAHQNILTILKDLIRHEVARRVISKIITHLPFTFLSVLVSSCGVAIFKHKTRDPFHT